MSGLLQQQLAAEERMALAKPDYVARMGPADVRQWLEFNRDLNSTPESKAWLHRAFAACRSMGIPDQPSLDHCVLMSSDNRELVVGIVVSSKTRILCCLLVDTDGNLQLDGPQTNAFQNLEPDQLVVVLLAYRATSGKA